ncbi:PAS domain-containing protein [Chloroflexota bacterium]
MEEKSVPSKKSRSGYLEALLQSCPSAIIAINSQGIMTFANEAAQVLLEREVKDLVGESITTVYETAELAKETNKKLHMSGGVVHDHESRVKSRTGKKIPVRISAAHLTDSSGNYIGAVGYFEQYRPWASAEASTKAYAEELEARLAEWRDLGAPVFELYPGLAAVVIIGRVDASRFERTKTTLFEHIKRAGSSVVMIEMAAALVDDDAIATELVKTIRTADLLGVSCVVAGMQTSLAMAMEPLVADISAIHSYSTTKLALEAALDLLGLEIKPNH